MDNFYAYDKETWEQFYPTNLNPITKADLENLKAFNDNVSLDDVTKVYMPLIHLISQAVENQKQWQNKKSDFLGQRAKRIPFIVGISGSVAVGKSTTARLLKYLFAYLLPNRKTQLITTDGFLYPTQTLKDKGILDRKGFPESYDMQRLIKFLVDVKEGQPEVKAPVYSHQVYDVLPDEFETVTNPDILIIEGINTFQIPEGQNIYISDFTDFSIYIDADVDLIESWFLNRFQQLLKTAFTDEKNYFYKYTKYSKSEALAIAKKIWKEIDLPNLNDFILPTRDRANLIIHKGSQHVIDKIYLRKY
ncbi:type I pantothenate kinase [Fructilactobacillus vespulae]|uniref:type I pantothenate kinase n=1 Tax=Fructilactobacillus vespulae TaxID=1249630 RepID=UPI0039B3DB7B